MEIGGLQKVTLINYPGLVSATVFVNGCNYRCPFCHNTSIVNKSYDSLDEEEVFAYLIERKKMLDGVCISGGEPTMQKDLEPFIVKLKNLGFKVKLDTNGYRPDLLENLISKNLLDYIAMDIKNSDDKYSLTSGIKVDINKINESINLVINSGIDYEFRTTVVKEFHTKEDIEKISLKIKDAKAYFIQNFEDSGDIMQNNLHGFNKEELLEFLEIAKQHNKNANLRGIE